MDPSERHNQPPHEPLSAAEAHERGLTQLMLHQQASGQAQHHPQQHPQHPQQNAVDYLHHPAYAMQLQQHQQQVYGRVLEGHMGGGLGVKEDGSMALHSQSSPEPSPTKPRQSSKYGFRFLKHERAQLEKWYQDHDGRTAPITIRKEWVAHWNAHRKHSKQQVHCEVSHQQVKQWFENMRRTRNHKTRNMMGGAGGVGGRFPGPGGHGGPRGPMDDRHHQGAPSMNPRLYLAASTGKMHQAIDKASQMVSKHIDQLQQIAQSPLNLSPASESAVASAHAGDGSQFRWDAINLQVIVDKLLGLLDSQMHNPSLPSPTSTITPQQEIHFKIFKEMLQIDRQLEPEWKALKEVSVSMECDPNNNEILHQASELVDLYMVKLEHVITEKTKILISLIGQLDILPSIRQSQQAQAAAAGKADPTTSPAGWGPEDFQKNAAWTRSWTIPPGVSNRRTIDSKLCAFMGNFLNDEQRANFFLGVPVHASALASAVCFSLESGDSERLTSQEAANLVSLYEVAAVQELELSEQLDKLWNLWPMQGDTDSSSNLWRSWLQDHHNPEIYYPLKVLADAVPAVDQQYGFISVTRNSLVLSLGFLKGLRYALPLPLFTKCMINFTQAHYLFAVSAMLEELSVMVSGSDHPDQPQGSAKDKKAVPQASSPVVATKLEETEEEPKQESMQEPVSAPPPPQPASPKAQASQEAEEEEKKETIQAQQQEPMKVENSDQKP